MWFLEQLAAKAFEQLCAAGIVPNPEQQAAFAARFGGDDSFGGSPILAVAGNNAEINITGILTNAPNFFAMLFGGGNVTYPEIVSALAEAESIGQVDNITLAIDSPGGDVSGLFEALKAIQATSKPTKAVVSGMAASAAFALAAQADTIEATSDMAAFGSIGTLRVFHVPEDEVVITSTNAPKKAPDPKTDAGVKAIRETLDEMHDVFASAVARGRGTTVANVNANFGEGALVLAQSALGRGMIDAIAGDEVSPVAKVNSGSTNQPEANTMDLATLKNDHQATYALAVAVGVAQERERAEAHLVLGEGSGDMVTSIAAIRDGSEFTSVIQAKHAAAAMNRNAVEAVVGDDAVTAAALANADTPPVEGDTMAEAVSDSLEKLIANE